MYFKVVELKYDEATGFVDAYLRMASNMDFQGNAIDQDCRISETCAHNAIMRLRQRKHLWISHCITTFVSAAEVCLDKITYRLSDHQDMLRRCKHLLDRWELLIGERRHIDYCEDYLRHLDDFQRLVPAQGHKYYALMDQIYFGLMIVANMELEHRCMKYPEIAIYEGKIPGAMKRDLNKRMAPLKIAV